MHKAVAFRTARGDLYTRLGCSFSILVATMIRVCVCVRTQALRRRRARQALCSVACGDSACLHSKTDYARSASTTCSFQRRVDPRAYSAALLCDMTLTAGCTAVMTPGHSRQPPAA